MESFVDALPYDYVFVQDLNGRYLFGNQAWRELGVARCNGAVEEEKELNEEGLRTRVELTSESARSLETLCQEIKNQYSRNGVDDGDNNDSLTNNSQQKCLQLPITLRDRTTSLWNVTLVPLRERNETVAVAGLIHASTPIRRLNEENLPVKAEEKRDQMAIHEQKQEKLGADAVSAQGKTNMTPVRVMVDNCSNLLALVDVQAGNILDCNRAFQEIYSLKPHQNLWQSQWAAQQPQQQVNQMQQLNQLPVAQRQLVLEWNLHLENDTWRHIRVSSIVSSQTVASVTGPIVLLLEEWDITAHKHEIQQFQSQQEALFHHLPIGYCMVELVTDEQNKPIDYIFLEINQQFEAMTGLTRETIIGKPVTQIVPGVENDPSDWIGRLGPVIQQNVVDLFMLFSESFQRWYSGVTYRHEGKIAVCLFTDCSQKRHMEEVVRESEERHLTLFENMQQGVVYHRADGNTMAANESALRILGLTMDQMLGKTPMDPQWKFVREDGSTLPVDEYPAVQALSGKYITSMIMGVYNCVDEDIRWIQVDGTPRFRPGEDKPYQAYTIFTDITPSQQIQQNLKRAKEKAEEADQLKSAFLATMSHEIRTPLNGIMGHLELMMANGLDLSFRDENMEGLQVAIDSGKLLISIIEDILDLSKIEAGQLDIVKRPFSLRSTVENTMKLANAYKLQRRKLQIKLIQNINEGIADRINGDQFRLQQGT